MSWGWSLEIWTLLSFIWWGLALYLVATERPRKSAAAAPESRRITIFKPLASPLSETELAHLRGCLESFISELDAASEMLIGCHTRDHTRVAAFVEEMRARYPAATIELIAHGDPNHAANPKISWMRILARHATGELWFWTDSDMEAPAGTLAALRTDFANTEAPMITSPYAVSRVGSTPAMLDKLFVNLEFYPGVMLLERLDLIQFGFGSGMLFEAERFRREIDWDYLGGCLADDFHLGRILGPARLGSTRLATAPAAIDAKGAILHYLRWQKTIRWCRPWSYAAQAIIIPLLGWMGWLLLEPTRLYAWLGFSSVIAVESLAAVVICRALACPIAWRHLAAVPLWSVLRALTWVACWLPWPIVWRGRRWWSPWRGVETGAKVLETGSQPGLE